MRLAEKLDWKGLGVWEIAEIREKKKISAEEL
jgi:hypothetical protein